MGDPLLKETDIGPLAKIEFVDKLDEFVKSSIKKGAKCLIGAKRKIAFTILHFLLMLMRRWMYLIMKYLVQFLA